MLKQQTGRRTNPGKAVLSGTATALTCAFAGAAILAWLVDREYMKMENIGYGILVGHVLAVYLGTRLAVTGAGKDGPAAAGITSAAYYLVLLLINGMFFGGSFAGLGTTAILVLLATAAAIVTNGAGKGRRRHRRYKIPK